MKNTFFCCVVSILFFSCGSPNSVDQKTAEVKTDSVAQTVQSPVAVQTATMENPVASPAIHKDTLCFEQRFKKDLKTVQLVLAGDEVTGTMDWTPWQKDGASGTIAGKKAGNIITVLYSYTIEGVDQKEEVVFKLNANELAQKSGELIDKNGVEVLKDPAHATFKEAYKKVDCIKMKKDAQQ